MKFNSVDCPDLNADQWDVVYEDTLPSAVSSVTISDLDGNTDGQYRLIGFQVANGTGDDMNVRLNNDSGSNYGQQAVYGSGSTAAGLRSTTLTALTGTNLNAGDVSLFDMLIHAKSGYNRTCISSQASRVTGTTIDVVRQMGQVWNNSADNITSIVLSSANSNIGVGSYICLLRPKRSTAPTHNSVEVPEGNLNADCFQTIYENTLDSAVTSVTISGLDGNTDLLYQLEMKLVSNYAGTNVVDVRPNNDSGSNYGFQYIRGASSAASASRNTSQEGLNLCFTSTATGRIALADGVLYAKSGQERTMVHTEADDVTGTTVTYSQMKGTVWNNSADNITSLVFASSQTNGLGSGTYIRLKAIKRSSL